MELRKNASKKEWPTLRLSCLRDHLGASLEAILARHRAGASGRDITAALTARIDALICALYADALDEQNGRMSPDYAIIAQGGYGRGALNPKSDIDLLFLFRKKVEEGDPITRAILHPLWDLHFEVGYSTRTLSDCVAAAQEDTDSLTAMLEARHIAGAPDLAQHLDDMLTRRFFGRKARTFINRKIEERKRRHGRAGASVQLLEPNVKESPGGLRDTHTVGWFLRARRGLRAPEGLLTDAMLTRRNYKLFTDALDFLLRTRNELHFCTNKSFDVLEHDLQPAIAQNLGYTDSDNALGVEHFMRSYYLHARAVKDISDLICERMQGQSSAARAMSLLARRELDDGAVLYPTHIGLPKKRKAFFADIPHRLLSIFLDAQRFGVPINEAAQQAVKDHLHLIDDDLRRSPRAARIFLDILRAPAGIAETLRTMHRLDVLGAYIPEFGGLTCLVQYNRYHIYTADEHTLVAIENLERLMRTPPALVPEDLRHLKRVSNEIPRKDLLFLGLLMHDAGKSARDSDHSTTGAQMTRTFLERINMPQEQIDIAAFLVQHHLNMSHIAQRRDLSDDTLIADFAAQFSHPDMLRMLYVLTYADLSAVARTAWTAWKAHLLRDLYEKTFRHLTQSETDRELAPKKDIQTLIDNLSNRFPPQKLVEHLTNMPPRYPGLNSPEEVARHLVLIDEMGDRPVAITVAPGGLFSEMTICTYDSPYRLSEICGVLATYDINIFSAQAYTRSDGIVIDIFQITGPDGSPDLAPELQQKIQDTLTAVAQGDIHVRDLFAKYQQRWSRRRKPAIPIPTEIAFENGVSGRYTVIDIAAQDATGLLYTITRTLSDLGLDIYTARIGTQADRAVDAFYVRKNSGKITDKEDIRAIVQTLLERIG